MIPFKTPFKTLLVRGGLLASLLGISFQTHAVEIMHWERKPLNVELPVGSERVIMLDRNVRVGLPREIADPNILRVQSAGGAIYLKADEAFDTQRVRVQDVETNQVVLIDLTAKENGASDEDIQVVFSDPNADSQEGGVAQDQQAQQEIKSSLRGTPIPVVLTRFAAQSLYAPSRTIEPVEGLSRVAMRLPETMPSLMPSLPVTATPVGAWKIGSWTVTAVRLSNQDPMRSFELDPRWLQGDLYSATFMHPTLARHGSVEDTTTVFIVTNGQSLAQALPLSQGDN